jgi:F420-dependent oxidoreductase-like protein
MQFRVMTEPQQGGSYDDILRVARLTEELGFDAFFRSDHLMRIGAGDPGPGSTESWVTLAGLARETTRIRLGTMVTSATFRRPGMLALTVATVDAMSGGRVELGLGGGWFEQEHLAYGIPFPSTAERFDALEEQLEALTGLWKTRPGESFSFSGKQVTLEDNPARPRPAQAGGIPIIVGGAGPTRTPRLAATYASEFNMPPWRTLDDTAQQLARVREACDRVGREPGSLVLSSVQGVHIGSDAEVRQMATDNETEVEDLGAHALAGAPAEIVDKIGRLAELGVSRIYLQLGEFSQAEQVERFAADVMPQLADAH